MYMYGVPSFGAIAQRESRSISTSSAGRTDQDLALKSSNVAGRRNNQSAMAKDSIVYLDMRVRGTTTATQECRQECSSAGAQAAAYMSRVLCPSNSLTKKS